MTAAESTSSISLTTPWRIGVDIGGTFTDMVLADATGSLWVFKEPSVPANPAQGVLDVLDRAAAACGLDRKGLLAGCNLFIHGSTVATNTVLERKGARVGMIVTEGFRDSLEIRRGIRFHQWDHRAPYPPVLAPRYLRQPVRGRINSDGSERIALDEGSVEAALAALKAEGIDSLAIALINSYVNPAHEHAVAAAAARHGGFERISVSADIAPILGEYERSSTTVLNAYIAPRVVSYLTALNRSLQEAGLAHPLLLVQSNGGVISVEQITERPVNLVLSGPAAGVGALNSITAQAGDDLISIEIGGTSCDVMLMSGGQIAVTDELEIAQYHVNIPSVDVHTVGAGGGTIAGVDAAGMLFAGPQGAGARPGPACYGMGGEEPTVTDAHLVLGRLAPGPIGGEGTLVLDADLACRAIDEKIAKPLKIDRNAAAAGVIRILEQHLLHAVERISVERGYDPKRFTLVAAGGAGPLHGASVARMLGCKRAYIPRLSGAFCALGMIHSKLRQDYFQVVHPVPMQEGLAQSTAEFAAMQDRALASLAQQGFSGAAVRVQRQMDLRYRGQQSSVRVEIAPGDLEPDTIRRDFEKEYRRQFGHVQPDGTIEITALRVAGIGHLPPLRAAPPAAATAEPDPRETREVYIDEVHGWKTARVYDGADLAPGYTLQGPLIVREPTTTVFIGPDDRLEVDPANNFVVHLH